MSYTVYTHPFEMKWDENDTKKNTKIMQRYAIEDNALYLKGQSNEIFDLQFFFHNSNLPGPRTNGVK